MRPLEVQDVVAGHIEGVEREGLMPLPHMTSSGNNTTRSLALKRGSLSKNQK